MLLCLLSVLQWSIKRCQTPLVLNTQAKHSWASLRMAPCVSTKIAPDEWSSLSVPLHTRTV